MQSKRTNMAVVIAPLVFVS